MEKNFALIKIGNEAGRRELRQAHDALDAHLRSELERQNSAKLTVPDTQIPAEQATAPIKPSVVVERESDAAVFPLVAFDNWQVNILVPPLLLGLMWLANRSPLVFFLKGFHVWMHEFGHATAAWMCGRRALPLPFGWTNVEPEYSSFVYAGLLLLFGILFVTGWKERKAWPMVAALVLAAVQFFMTWRMTERQQEFWWGAFGGVGGEFYLSALLMVFFFVELPEKFRWGMCRYVFFLIGATTFLNIVTFWNQVYHGVENIPFGTMINGEDDQGGDMNKLMDLYGWSYSDIRRNYQFLGRYCWIGLGMAYAGFALRLNLIPDKVIDWYGSRNSPEKES